MYGDDPQRPFDDPHLPPGGNPPPPPSGGPPSGPPPREPRRPARSADAEGTWEQRTLEKLAFAALKEQKSSRRWGIFFKFLTFAYLAIVLMAVIDLPGMMSKKNTSLEKHTALVELRGVIDSTGNASADKITSALDSAFKDEGTAGVIMRINSPGGSPVQAGIIYDEIKRLRAKYPAKPLYVVVEDLCASGGYYVASAADKIYVDKASIVGSIGVIMDGFGFTGTMEKLGVERRAYHAGENKTFLDPFSPVNDKQVQYVNSMLEDIHQQFISVVRKGRGKRLKEDADTFSGLMWTGEKSIAMGLTDGLGTVDSVARDVIKAENIVDYSEHDNVAERLAKKFGASAAGAVMERMAPQTIH
ncbi:MAG TPA: S49 family peptidase [Burkholderiales bacterium]